MLDFVLQVLAGGLVGFAVGLTGVGGGSLMTPILLLMGNPASVAIGTDLLYAAFTKAGGVYFHHSKGNVQWKTMGLLALGSIPVSVILSVWVLDASLRGNPGLENLLTTALGLMLVFTSLVLVFHGRIQRRLNAGNGAEPAPAAPGNPSASGGARPHAALMTILLGVLLGFCVTLTSVGAGAIGAAILFLLYPRWNATWVVGTDIGHAVPLTLVAGIGYLLNGLVDLVLLASLMIGSLPGIYLGTHVGAIFPDKVMRGILITLLLSLGLYFSFIH